MAKLMLHRQILKNFGGLPVKVQRKISEWVERFQKDPRDPAIGLHGVKESMIDPKVRGAELPGGYRAIVIEPDEGETFLLVHIDKHDSAYRWARNKRFEVHQRTGTFQVFDLEQVEAAAQEATTRETGEPPPAPADGQYPLARLSDEELFHAGVPRPLIPSVRSVQSDEGFDAIAAYLPPDCRDVLFGLAAGMSLDEALEQMLGVTGETEPDAVPAGPGDFSRIEDAANYDLVFVEGEEHLRDILQSSIEEWRVFLHPYQRKLVRWQTKGPMSISGAAGTGKTVALMHRAVHLARQVAEPTDRVLVTTFTTNLPVTIRQHLALLDPKAAERIEVTNLHALARTICFRSGWQGRIASDEEIEEIWEDVWRELDPGDMPMSREEMREEYARVIDPYGIDSEDVYLTTVRSGRRRMSRQQRRKAWPAFRLFQRGLHKRNRLTFEGAVHQARLSVEKQGFQRYAHVLVDEVQDFSLEALRLIRALSPIGEGSPDPLCTAGDGHQRIYHRKIPMSRAGIDIRGRSRRLKINYRTSEQIRRWAQGILRGVEIDDLDGGTTTTVGDRSAFQGPEPESERCASDEDEARAVVRWVKGLLEDQGFATHEICVTPGKPAIRRALSDAEIPTVELRPREGDPGAEVAGVRLGTIKRIKGLEFRAVAMACASPDDPMQRLQEADLLQRCERYVAATRARERLLITLKG